MAKQKKIDIYANKETLKTLYKKHDYCFFGGQGYLPILKGNLVKKNFSLTKKKERINVKSFYVNHGQIKSTAYVVGKLAYISDTNGIFLKDYSKLKNLKYLIIDCLKFNSHPSHFNFEQAIKISKTINAKKTILTNLHSDLDYNFLKKTLPKDIVPAHDGMVLNL